MAHAEKSRLYQELKRLGIAMPVSYQKITTAQLQELAEQNGVVIDAPAPEPGTVAAAVEAPREDPGLGEKLDRLADTVASLVQLQLAAQTPPGPAPFPSQVPQGISGPGAEPAPVAQQHPRRPQLDPNEHAGVTQNSHAADEVIEVDEYGNQWYQKEVTKPGYAKPRGRRVLRTMDAGVQQETIKVGEYTETFEVSGDPRNARPTEIKVTLPSFQVGIYRSPGMPFKIHTYNGVRGFDLRDVQEFYGGSDLVPDTIKRCYVSTSLCYDIATTIRTVEDEYRSRVLGQQKGF